MPLFEYYNTGDDGTENFHDDLWRGQNFITSEAHSITSVKVKLLRVSGQSPGIVTAMIYACDAGHLPSGSAICSGTTNGNTVTTISPGEWREISMGAGANLTADTEYTVALKSEVTVINKLWWRKDGSSSLGWDAVYSMNQGGDWYLQYDYIDYMFEIWGLAEEGLENKSANMAAKMIAVGLI